MLARAKSTTAQMPVRMSSAEFRRQQNYKEKDPLKVYIGKRNKESGDVFEAYLENACKKYLDDGLADIAKAHEPLRVVGRLTDRTFKCVYTKKADPDFKGMLNTGLAIGFEAKHTETDRIEQNAITRRQEDVLDRQKSMNAMVFVMVSFGMDKFFCVPWSVWKNMKGLYGRKYLKVEDLHEYEVRMKLYEGKPAVLFLDTMEIPMEQPRLRKNE